MKKFDIVTNLPYNNFEFREATGTRKGILIFSGINNYVLEPINTISGINETNFPIVSFNFGNKDIAISNEKHSLRIEKERGGSKGSFLQFNPDKPIQIQLGTNYIDNQGNLFVDDFNLTYKTGYLNLDQRPHVNGTGVLLSGEAAQVDLSSTVRTTGDQTISGIKTFVNNQTFSGNINVSGTGILNALDLNNIDNLSLSGVDITITSGNIVLTNRPTVNNTGIFLSGETILASQISNSTSAGRTLLTGSVQTQRDALSLFPSYSSYQNLVTSGPQQTSRIYVTTNDWRTYSWVPSINQYIEVSPSVSSVSSGVAISSGINGNFSNLAGLTKNSFAEWWDGVPFGWSGVNTTFTIRSGAGSNNYAANIGQLSAGPSGNSFRQNLGTLPITSNVQLTFTYSEPFVDAVLNVAIYNGTYGNLATGEYTIPGTYTLTANSIPANTNIIIGFWTPNTGTVNPILDDVSVSQTTLATTWIFPTGLPRNNNNLPSGALWVDTSAGNVLKIVV